MLPLTSGAQIRSTTLPDRESNYKNVQATSGQALVACSLIGVEDVQGSQAETLSSTGSDAGRPTPRVDPRSLSKDQTRGRWVPSKYHDVAARSTLQIEPSPLAQTA
jgi:hypothetical protein